MVRFRTSAGKSNKTVSTSWSFTGDRWFESISLSGESPANLNTSIRVDPGGPILAPKKRLVSIPAEWRQGWQGSALAPSRNPVTQR
jgi:hypothetical protein